MTRIKLFGQIKRLMVLFSAILFTTCGGINKYGQHDKLIKEDYNYYINDSLAFSYRFPADYNRINDWKAIDKTTRKRLKKTFSSKEFIVGFKTDTAPALEHYLFYQSDKAIASLKGLEKCVALDEAAEKGYQYMNAVDHTTAKIVKLKEKQGYVHLWAKSDEQSFNNLLNEYDHNIFKTFVTGEGYNDKQPESPFDLAANAFLNGDSSANFLMPLYVLDRKKDNYVDRNPRSSFLQVAATYHSFTDNSPVLQDMVQEWRQMSYFGKKDKQSFPMTHTNEAAFDYLVERCAKKQIVMFNEAHFVPKHRILVHKMLKALAKEGFTHLALESLWEKDQALNDRGFVILESGFYTREPEMANLIRSAIELGYQVIGYDDFTKDREKNQAKNIYEKTIKNNANAKVLVLAGFGHISERVSTRKNMMAVEFKQQSGIDPLTIDQIEFELKDQHWLGIVDSLQLGDLKRIPVDLYVYNNLQEKQSPAVDIEIPIDAQQKLKKIKGNYRGIIQIYLSDEFTTNARAIPYQNIIISDEKIVRAQLKSNDYWYRILDRYGTVLVENQLPSLNKK